MTERLYYHDSFLYEFDAEVRQVLPASDATSLPAVVFDRTAFYPTSGGQVSDTGWIVSRDSDNTSQRTRIAEVAEREDGSILHFMEAPSALKEGMRVHGTIDAERRRDHMQQHSGQHVLSAAFVRLFNMPTVSFHMGEDYCSIDLETKNLSSQQIESAEKLANDVVMQNRPVDIRFVSQKEALELGVRKLPPLEREQLRLIDIRDFDLTACGGTHVSGTGQIGCILLRKAEKVKQGWRIEFVCGIRAVNTARRDYSTLTEAAGLFSSHLRDVPEQIQKAQEEARIQRRTREQLLGELADVHAAAILADTPETHGRKVVTRTFPDRDLTFIKLLAQRLTRLNPNTIALLASTSSQPALVFAASPGQPFDMGALMREALARLGGRGGGSKDMAQGGPQQVEQIALVLAELQTRIQ